MHKNRVLGSQTIISDRLYVERGADAQLAQVIEDMGRPAYVLVARQMGKTNLLLHAKRKLAKANDAFVYLDASNPYPTLDGFFKNIVDTILDSDHDRFADARTRIALLRQSSNGPAHRDHERELLHILSAITGRLVIIIDEVDALGAAPYSDGAFSYIRSVYFSGRINFPAFERLTYVLSGVAEPTELIKNKAISPFNIGQKIYLDDFTRSEFGSFVNQAGLDISEDTADRIYYWTSGNPRISWDVCAALEGRFEELNGISRPEVDELIRLTYFKNFDVPPVDHIRKLVANDPAIRDALTSIHWGKSASIDSHTADRLYLSGIVRFADPKDLQLKNRIIAEAVSESWLRELEGKSVAFLRMANAAYDSQRWDEAFALYNEYCDTVSPEVDLSSVCYLQGNCKFNTEDFAGAVALFTKAPLRRETSGSLYYAEKYRLAVCYHQIGQRGLSLETFQEVLEQGAKPGAQFYYEALVNVTGMYLADFDKYQDDIFRNNKEVIENEAAVLELNSGDTIVVNRLITVAHWNLSVAYSRLSNTAEALRQIDLAISRADERYIVGLFFQKMHLLKNKLAAFKVAEQCADHIIKNRMRPYAPSSIYQLSFTQQTCAELLYTLAFNHKSGSFRALVAYLKNILDGKEDLSFDSTLAKAGASAMSNGNPDAAAELFRIAYLSGTEGASKDRRFTATLAILLSASDDVSDLEKQYVSEFWRRPQSKLISTDFRLAYGFVYSHLPAEPGRAFEVLKIVEELLPAYAVDVAGTVEEDALFIGRCVLELLRIDVLIAAGHTADLREVISSLIDEFQGFHGRSVPTYFPEDIAATAIRRLQAHLKGLMDATLTRRVGRKIGRNEYVSAKRKDGSVITAKFKRVEAELRSGELTLLSVQ